MIHNLRKEWMWNYIHLAISIQGMRESYIVSLRISFKGFTLTKRIKCITKMIHGEAKNDYIRFCTPDVLSVPRTEYLSPFLRSSNLKERCRWWRKLSTLKTGEEWTKNKCYCNTVKLDAAVTGSSSISFLSFTCNFYPFFTAAVNSDGKPAALPTT